MFCIFGLISFHVKLKFKSKSPTKIIKQISFQTDISERKLRFLHIIYSTSFPDSWCKYSIIQKTSGNTRQRFSSIIFEILISQLQIGIENCFNNVFYPSRFGRNFYFHEIHYQSNWRFKNKNELKIFHNNILASPPWMRGTWFGKSHFQFCFIKLTVIPNWTIQPGFRVFKIDLFSPISKTWSLLSIIEIHILQDFCKMLMIYLKIN